MNPTMLQLTSITPSRDRDGRPAFSLAWRIADGPGRGKTLRHTLPAAAGRSWNDLETCARADLGNWYSFLPGPPGWVQYPDGFHVPRGHLERRTPFPAEGMSESRRRELLSGSRVGRDVLRQRRHH